jgi:hypothetical protein
MVDIDIVSYRIDLIDDHPGKGWRTCLKIEDFNLTRVIVRPLAARRFQCLLLPFAPSKHHHVNVLFVTVLVTKPRCTASRIYL